MFCFFLHVLESLGVIGMLVAECWESSPIGLGPSSVPDHIYHWLLRAIYLCMADPTLHSMFDFPPSLVGNL